MKSTINVKNKNSSQIKFLDKFTKNLLAIMIVILVFIFAAGKYMDSHKMAAGGTDDKVNNLATAVSSKAHHPFIELPGDAQLGAFSVANFFGGLILGHQWEKIFGKNNNEQTKEEESKKATEET